VDKASELQVSFCRWQYGGVRICKGEWPFVISADKARACLVSTGWMCVCCFWGLHALRRLNRVTGSYWPSFLFLTTFVLAATASRFAYLAHVRGILNVLINGFCKKKHDYVPPSQYACIIRDLSASQKI
jgi:hypothetical protein